MTDGQPFGLNLRETQGYVEAEVDSVDSLKIDNYTLGGEVDEEG